MPDWGVRGSLSATSAPIEVKNKGEDAIPAFSVVQISEASKRESRIILNVVKLEAPGWRASVMVTGEIEIQPDGYGEAFFGPVVCCKFDPQDGTPKKGETWGPVNDSFLIRKNVPGGRVLIDAEEGIAVLLRYDPPDIFAQLTEDLEAGDKAEAKLLYWDPTAEPSGGEQFLTALDDVRLDVYEGTGLVDTLDSGTKIICRWDDQAQKYILRGWVC